MFGRKDKILFQVVIYFRSQKRSAYVLLRIEKEFLKKAKIESSKGFASISTTRKGAVLDNCERILSKGHQFLSPVLGQGITPNIGFAVLK